MDKVEAALGALRAAWVETCADYGARKLNSERALQAALYFHLRPRLEDISPEFRIFIEAQVEVPAVEAGADTEAEGKRNIAIDTLVCLEREVLLAIELKYTPRGFPDFADLQKDLTSLDQIRNRRERRVKIELKRHRDTEADEAMTLRISPNVRMILGICCSDATPLELKTFWSDCAPAKGRWARRFREHLPPKLGLCLAYAPAPTGGASPAIPVFLGRPFAPRPDEIIVSRFSGAVGPAFDEEDLRVALDAGDTTLESSSREGEPQIAANAAIKALAGQIRQPGGVASVLALVECAPGVETLSSARVVSSALRAHYGDAVHLVAGARLAPALPGGVGVTLWARIAS